MPSLLSERIRRRNQHHLGGRGLRRADEKLDDRALVALGLITYERYVVSLALVTPKHFPGEKSTAQKLLPMCVRSEGRASDDATFLCNGFMRGRKDIRSWRNEWKSSPDCPLLRLWRIIYRQNGLARSQKLIRVFRVRACWLTLSHRWSSTSRA